MFLRNLQDRNCQHPTPPCHPTSCPIAMSHVQVSRLLLISCIAVDYTSAVGPLPDCALCGLPLVCRLLWRISAGAGEREGDNFRDPPIDISSSRRFQYFWRFELLLSSDLN